MKINDNINFLIEKKRQELQLLVEKRKKFDSTIIEKSQELDILLNKLSFFQKKRCIK